MKTAAGKNGVYRGKPCSADSVKKRLDFQGIKICIDRPKGFVMMGKDDKGQPWSRKYKYDYGFIPKTLGGDGDGIDVFIGPDKKAEEAYWAIQTKPDGSFDEYKVFLGFPNREAAIGAYKDHIPKKFFKGLVTLRVSMMRAMLKMDPQEPMKKVAVWIGFHDELEKMAHRKKSPFALSRSGRKKVKQTKSLVRRAMSFAKRTIKGGPNRQLIDMAEAALEPVVGEIK